MPKVFELQSKVVIAISMITLLDYLYYNKLTPKDLQKAIGEKYVKNILRWCRHERKPRKDKIEMIRAWTDGEVTAIDFEEAAVPRSAVMITLPSGKKWMVTPFSDDDDDLDAAYEASRFEMLEPYSPQVMDAIRTLGHRVRIRSKDSFFLYGRPSDVRRVVVAANRMRIPRGQLPIRYPGVNGARLSDWATKRNAMP
ncbi:MAG: hypothetical protein KF691_04100 [Phycisphaeraceae bacterium]|nr:hypothetical protein [Phycisphaeraceae bacterium]